MLPDDDELIPLFPGTEDSPAGERPAGASGQTGESPNEPAALQSLVALHIVDLVPDFAEAGENGEPVDISALLAQDDRGAVFEVPEIAADGGSGAGDSFAVTFPKGLSDLDDPPGDSGIT